MPNTRALPSRAWKPYVYNHVDSSGLRVAEADADRQSLLVVNTSSTVTVYLIPGNTGGAHKSVTIDSPEVWPLTPGEGVTFTTAAEVIAITAGTDVGSVKVMAERGVVGCL